jgi:hypothetical protein
MGMTLGIAQLEIDHNNFGALSHMLGVTRKCKEQKENAPRKLERTFILAYLKDSCFRW